MCIVIEGPEIIIIFRILGENPRVPPSVRNPRNFMNTAIHEN